FWEATKEQRLVLQWCKSCGNVVHYPREVCPFCMSEDLEYRPATGKGEVYAYTVIHRAQNPAMESQVPYVVALVNLVEGARMMTNVVNCPPEKVKVGMPVSVTWEELSDGRNLPLFEPA
ncbi:MAG: Zn-ribbon domain-containing OB-fold protein, partial [Acidimicrobiia bacterium]